MYRNLGYYIDSQAEVLIPAARILLAKHGATFDTVFADAFREAGLSDRRWMKDLTRDDYIQIGKSAAFGNGTPENRALLHWLYAIAAVSGWGDYRPQRVRYASHPQMTLDEILLAALNDHLDTGLKEIGSMWPEKCSVETFRTHLASCIKRAAVLYEYRPYMVDKLERYISDLLYKMQVMEISPTSLDQFDRTLLTKIIYEGDTRLTTWTDSSDQEQTLSFTSQKDSDPLIGPEIARIKNVCQPGPWMRYCRLLSNMDQRELIYMLTPVLPDLPLATGYLLPVGPFHEVELSVQQRITWGDAEQYAGFAENVTFPPYTTATTQRVNLRTPAFTDMTRGYLEHIYDWPTLEIVDDIGATVSGQGTAHQLRYSWYSPTLQRMLHDTSGGDIDALIYDLACTHKELGETPCTMTNIQDLKWADLSYLPDDRRINLDGGSGPDDKPGLRSAVKSNIFFFEGGKNLRGAEEVDVTALYHKLGNITYRPALAEYFKPSRAWFLQLDQNTIDYIAGKLQLNVYDAQRSKLAIAISHNVSMYKRVTGATEDPFDVEEVIKAMYGMVNMPPKATTVMPTIAPKPKTTK